MLHKNIHKSFTGRLFSAMVLCTYMAEKQRLIVVFSQPNEYIKCYQLIDYKLTYGTIMKLKDLIANNIGLFTISQITFNYNITYSDATVKSNMLSHHIQKLTLYGSSMHSKGAYLINIPATIWHSDKPHQIVADYLVAVLCHNIQTSSSYQKAVLPSLDIHMKSNLKQISCFRFLGVTSIGIDTEAAIDITAVVSHNTTLQELWLTNNNVQSTSAINIFRALHIVVTLTLINLTNNNIEEEAADDIAAVLSHNINLQILYLSDNNLKSAGAIKIAQGLKSIVKLTQLGFISQYQFTETVFKW